LAPAANVRSDVREGRFCAILFETARKSLILNGEMSEWLKEHAWKLLLAVCDGVLQISITVAKPTA